MRHITPPFYLAPLCRGLTFAVLTCSVAPALACATEAARSMSRASQEDVSNNSGDANNSEVVIFQKNVDVSCDTKAAEAGLCLEARLEAFPTAVNDQITD